MTRLDLRTAFRTHMPLPWLPCACRGISPYALRDSAVAGFLQGCDTCGLGGKSLKGGRAFWRAIVGGVLAALLVVVLFRAAGKDLFWWHHHTVTLTWKASTSSEVIGYQVYRKVLPSGENTRINATLVNGLSFVDERVESGKRGFRTGGGWRALIAAETLRGAAAPCSLVGGDRSRQGLTPSKVYAADIRSVSPLLPEVNPAPVAALHSLYFRHRTWRSRAHP